MKTCNGCKWAEWKKTANGRLHPDGGGTCTFPVKMPVLPACLIGTYYGDAATSAIKHAANGYRGINRRGELRDHCAYYARQGSTGNVIAKLEPV